MSKWLRKVSGLKGQTTAEYAIIVALIAVSSIAIILLFGDQIRNMFKAQTEQLSGDESSQTEAVDINEEDTQGGLDTF